MTADRSLRVLQGTVLLLLAFKLWVSLTMAPVGDEAYYWLWGQRPALSYFDHPPLHAWLLGLMGKLFGWNLFALRALTWASLAATLLVFYGWSKRLSPADPSRWFWTAAAIYLASPLFFGMTSIAFNDHLLIALLAGSAHFFLRFAESAEAETPRHRWLYLAAILLGLAVLTKYNAVLFGLGVGAFFLAHWGLRASLRTHHPWLAAALAIAMQAPVFWWNATNGLASYEFHLSTRIEFLRPFGPPMDVIIGVIAFSPFLIPAVLRYLRQPAAHGFARTAKAVAVSVFVVSSVAMLTLSLVVPVFFYWNIVALLMLPVLIAGIIGRSALWGHLAYGTVVGLFAGLTALAVPPFGTLGGRDWTLASMQGWPEVAEAIAPLRESNPNALLAATSYITASELGWELQTTEIVSLSDRPDQFDLWFDAAAHAGVKALVVTDPVVGLAPARTRFESLSLVAEVPVSRYGQPYLTYQIYLGEGFRP